MSGIAGLYRPERTVEGAELEAMIGALDHRGPDGSGTWTGRSTGLGHQQLQTTPQDRHTSPPVTEHELVVTADARLDNRNELEQELDVREGARPVSDTALLLAAYDRWGVHCPEHLLGAFAFAVWDKSARTLFAARDHMGIKPFYYHYGEPDFAFGSEIKALLALDGVPCRLNETRVGDYLAETFDDESITFYEGILRLPPAHALWVTPTGIMTRNYWSLDPSWTVEFQSDEAYSYRFRELFTDAVNARLRSLHPVGTTLSGGLDSSVVTCVAADRVANGSDGPDRLHTISAVFPDVPECDERSYIETVLGQIDVYSHFVRADDTSPLAEFQRVIRHQDEPFYAPNLFMHRLLYRTATNNGIRVLLDGLDGDTTVSHGIGRVTDLATSGRVVRAISEARALAPVMRTGQAKPVLNFVVKPVIQRLLRRFRPYIRADGDSTELPGIVDPEFAGAIDLRHRLDATDWSGPPELRNTRVSHYEDLTSGLIPFALEVADKAAAEFGVEPRYPFFDKRLVEYCLALPPEQKLRNGMTRYVLREAMARKLPNEIYDRHWKTDLSPNFERNLLLYERDKLERILLDTPRYLDEWINVETVQQHYRQYVSGDGDKSISVWKPLTLALWLESLTTGMHPERDCAEVRTNP